MLRKAIRILGASTCDEAVARVALELALREAEAEKQLAIQEVESEMKLAIKDAESEMKMAMANKEADMKNDMKNKIALLRYKYAAVSSRFWLEKLFADIRSFAVEKKWENFESMSNSKGRLSMTAINGYLRSRPKKWQRFVAAHDLETAISSEFPELPSKTLLYGALSDEIHRPPELCVIELPDGEKSMPYLVLLRDIGRHYQRKEGLSVATIDLERAWATIIKGENDD